MLGENFWHKQAPAADEACPGGELSLGVGPLELLIVDPQLPAGWLEPRRLAKVNVASTTVTAAAATKHR